VSLQLEERSPVPLWYRTPLAFLQASDYFCREGPWGETETSTRLHCGEGILRHAEGVFFTLSTGAATNTSQFPTTARTLSTAIHN
jgi:hypothetical protein